MNELLAHFNYELVDDVVVIYDCDTGSHGITNDIQNVLSAVDEELRGIGYRRVIYRDSTQTFDGVDHIGQRFTGFYPLNETVLEAALSKVLSNAMPLGHAAGFYPTEH